MTAVVEALHKEVVVVRLTEAELLVERDELVLALERQLVDALLLRELHQALVDELAEAATALLRVDDNVLDATASACRVDDVQL